MLPFFRERIEARRLLIYDHSNASQHPLNAVELTNSGDTTMDGATAGMSAAAYRRNSDRPQLPAAGLQAGNRERSGTA